MAEPDVLSLLTSRPLNRQMLEGMLSGLLLAGGRRLRAYIGELERHALQSEWEDVDHFPAQEITASGLSVLSDHQLVTLATDRDLLRGFQPFVMEEWRGGRLGNQWYAAATQWLLRSAEPVQAAAEDVSLLADRETIGLDPIERTNQAQAGLQPYWLEDPGVRSAVSQWECTVEQLLSHMARVDDIAANGGIVSNDQELVRFDQEELRLLTREILHFCRVHEPEASGIGHRYYVVEVRRTGEGQYVLRARRAGIRSFFGITQWWHWLGKADERTGKGSSVSIGHEIIRLSQQELRVLLRAIWGPARFQEWQACVGDSRWHAPRSVELAGGWVYLSKSELEQLWARSASIFADDQTTSGSHELPARLREVSRPSNASGRTESRWAASRWCGGVVRWLLRLGGIAVRRVVAMGRPR